MPLAIYLVLAHKSLAAALAAIEIYNKPNFTYREETFSILMINAWELILKARIVQKKGGSWRSIQVGEYKRKKDGTNSRQQTLKRNRSGQPMTIGLERAAGIVHSFGGDGIDEHCIANLRLLQSIRDNAVHLYNIAPHLAHQIYQVGSAALKNFLVAYESWFGYGLERCDLFLLPLAFQNPAGVVESPRTAGTDAVRRLMAEIADAEQQHPSGPSDRFDVTIQVELKFIRTADPKAVPVRIDPKNPSAISVTLREEQIREKYPWDYEELTERLKSRYSDFRVNREYHRIRKGFESDGALCHVRYLDPQNKAGTKRKFYSPNIISHLDREYTRR